MFRYIVSPRSSSRLSTDESSLGSILFETGNRAIGFVQKVSLRCSRLPYQYTNINKCQDDY